MATFFTTDFYVKVTYCELNVLYIFHWSAHLLKLFYGEQVITNLASEDDAKSVLAENLTVIKAVRRFLDALKVKI